MAATVDSIYRPYSRRVITSPVDGNALVQQQIFPVGSLHSSLVVSCPWHLQFLRQSLRLAQLIVFSPRISRLTAIALTADDTRLALRSQFPPPLDPQSREPPAHTLAEILRARQLTPVTLVINLQTSNDGLVFVEEPSVIHIRESVGSDHYFERSAS